MAVEDLRCIKDARRSVSQAGFMDEKTNPPSPRPPIWRTAPGRALLVASGVGAYFLLTRHFDHLLQAVPYLVLLACPLMHVFMHGHHGHGPHREDGTSDTVK